MTTKNKAYITKRLEHKKINDTNNKKQIHDSIANAKKNINSPHFANLPIFLDERQRQQTIKILQEYIVKKLDNLTIIK